MNPTPAITRNTAALQSILATLLYMLGLDDGPGPERISRTLHNAALRLLRPAESAVRRLIVIAAQGLVVKLRPSRTGPILAAPGGKGSSRPPSFRLFDPPCRTREHPWRTPVRGIPRIHVFTGDPRIAAVWAAAAPRANPAPEPDTTIETAPIRRRLAALEAALGDLPRQARRLARWQAKREKLPDAKPKSPLRPGRPPGHRRTPLHDVDHVLDECHGLAMVVLRPDSS
jgi:hypothetical protein